MTYLMDLDLSPYSDTDVTTFASTKVFWSAADQSINLRSGTFPSQFQTNAAIHVFGASNNDNNFCFQIDERVSSTKLRLSPIRGRASAVANETQSSTVLIQNGESPSFWNNVFNVTSSKTPENAPYAAIATSDDGYKCIKKFTPVGYFYNAETGWHWIIPFDEIQGGTNFKPTEIWQAFRMKFLSNTSGGYLQTGIGDSYTGNIVMENLYGRVDRNFPEDQDLPRGSGANAIRTRDWGGEIILGDDTDPTSYEILQYQTRTGTGSTRTLTGPLRRGGKGTTRKSWPAGTKITYSYDAPFGHKIPGIYCNQSGGGSPGVTYTLGRPYFDTYVPDFNRPQDWEMGCLASYHYYCGKSADHDYHGYEYVPSGIPAGAKWLLPNKWYTIEFRLKLNSSPGVKDGESEMIVNGVTQYLRTNIEFRCSNWNPTYGHSYWDMLSIQNHYGGGTKMWNCASDNYWLLRDWKVADEAINLYQIDYIAKTPSKGRMGIIGYEPVESKIDPPIISNQINDRCMFRMKGGAVTTTRTIIDVAYNQAITSIFKLVGGVFPQEFTRPKTGVITLKGATLESGNVDDWSSASAQTDTWTKL